MGWISKLPAPASARSAVGHSCNSLPTRFNGNPSKLPPTRSSSLSNLFSTLCSLGAASSSNDNGEAKKRLEYQHGFHAGNFADVFKHVILVMLLQHMQQKAKPIGYIETHAGAGLYNLPDASSSSGVEYEQEHQRGVWRFLDLIQKGETSAEDTTPVPVASFLDIVRSFQKPNSNLIYPGSPLFAASLLVSNQQTQDHTMILYEKAPSQYELLQNHLNGFLSSEGNDIPIQLKINLDNGYAGLSKYAASTPSLPPRTLILIDPPYQYGSDTDQIVTLCQTLHRHWRSARIAIWHPVRKDHAEKLERLYSMLRANYDGDMLAIEVYAPSHCDDEDRKPDVGTGMILLQPPYGLDKDCHTVLPWLLKQLGLNMEEMIQIKWL